MNKLKVVCTIGPSTWVPETMKACIENGLTVARVNGAFADTAELDRVKALVRANSDTVALMVDVKGPEVRMNKFAEAKPIKVGDIIEFGNSDKYDIFPANYPDTYKHMVAGQKIMIGDGDVRLEVTEQKSESFMAKVTAGMLLKPGKAMNFPGLRLNDNPLTDKDIVLLNHAAATGWDMVSASFIRTAKDVEVVRKALGDSKMTIMAKVEDEEGVDNIEEIMAVVDTVMVARGGLGVEMGVERVPLSQKKIFSAAYKYGKPVLMATQMFESMLENPMPTRAEVNDVANAVWSNADAVMFSGETTIGKYPALAVEYTQLVDKDVRHLVEPKLSPMFNVAEDVKADVTKAFEMAVAAPDKTLVVTTNNLRLLEVLAKCGLKNNVKAIVPTIEFARQLAMVGGVTEVEVNETASTTTQFSIV